MPTGYTADIAKGITFKQFALNCARAFGALITMRDDPSDADIPERFEPSDYDVKAIAKTLKEIEEISSMNDAELDKLVDEAYRKELKSHLDHVAEKKEQEKKYRAMLAEAQNYEPPTPDHIEYKKFMIEQIEKSIEWDCNYNYDKAPEKQTTSEYKKNRIEMLKRDVAYHTKKNQEEIERVEGRNEWIKALRESLKKYN